MDNIRITGTGQLLELQRRLRAAGNEPLRASMQRRIRRAAEPLRDDLQNTVLRLPIRSQGGAGRSGPSPTTRPMRATISAAIRISVRNTAGGAGARIWIDRDALPVDLRAMPNRLEDARWRHPVFANRSRWTTKYASPWWSVTVNRHQPRMTAEVERVIDDVQRRLGG